MEKVFDALSCKRDCPLLWGDEIANEILDALTSAFDCMYGLRFFNIPPPLSERLADAGLPVSDEKMNPWREAPFE